MCAAHRCTSNSNSNRHRLSKEIESRRSKIERRHSPVPIEETLRFVADRGIVGSFLDDRGEPRPLAAFDPDVHQRLHGRAGRYVNSFLFRPRATS
jgi:hypothetical protein